MNPLSLRSLTLLQKLLLASLASLPLGAACSTSDSAPPTPVEITLTITGIEGPKIVEPIRLRCDGTLAVNVSITTVPADAFILRPARACASSSRCGYVHLEALDADGNALASVDTATTGGLLRLPTDSLAAVSQITARLLRGIDDEPVLNPDKTEVTAGVSPSFQLTENCPGQSGAGGAATGGAAGAPATGGAAGDSTLPAAGGAGLGGAATGGEAPVAAVGGAGGDGAATGGVGGI